MLSPDTVQEGRVPITTRLQHHVWMHIPNWTTQSMWYLTASYFAVVDSLNCRSPWLCHNFLDVLCNLISHPPGLPVEWHSPPPLQQPIMECQLFPPTPHHPTDTHRCEMILPFFPFASPLTNTNTKLQSWRAFGCLFRLYFINLV